MYLAGSGTGVATADPWVDLCATGLAASAISGRRGDRPFDADDDRWTLRVSIQRRGRRSLNEFNGLDVRWTGAASSNHLAVDDEQRLRRTLIQRLRGTPGGQHRHNRRRRLGGWRRHGCGGAGSEQRYGHEDEQWESHGIHTGCGTTPAQYKASARAARDAVECGRVGARGRWRRTLLL